MRACSVSHKITIPKPTTLVTQLNPSKIFYKNAANARIANNWSNTLISTKLPSTTLNFNQRYFATNQQTKSQQTEQTKELSFVPINTPTEKWTPQQRETYEVIRDISEPVPPASEIQLLSQNPPHKLQDLAFAVVQLTGKQFKVTPGDVLVVSRLNGCDIGDKIVLDKVLMIGTQKWTAFGTPMLKAGVYAIVEEQTEAAEILIFKKKRRKHYRKLNPYRHSITTLRITDIDFNYQEFFKNTPNETKGTSVATTHNAT